MRQNMPRTAAPAVAAAVAVAAARVFNVLVLGEPARPVRSHDGHLLPHLEIVLIVIAVLVRQENTLAV